MIQGLPGSTGIAIGPAWVYRPLEIKFERVEDADPEKEWARFQKALEQAKAQLEDIEHKTRQRVGDEEGDIFGAHRMFLEDPELISTIKTNLDQQLNAEAAVQDGIEDFAQALRDLESEYFQERAGDVLDVGRRVVACLSGIDLSSTDMPNEPVVIFADDLTPSDTVQFDPSLILGFCTRRGGPTSHTAILARGLGVPAIVSAPIEIDRIQSRKTVVLDGESGEVYLNPDRKQLEEAEKKRQKLDEKWAHDLKMAHQPTVTKDGHEVEVVANIGSLADAHQAVEYGAEGVGLLRTEFLYINRAWLPDLDEQIKVYRDIFDAMGNHAVVVRTLDIGGDKAVSYLGLRDEPNPFLGWRAIRMIGERPEVLSDQFEALLLAGADADLRIMLPLVSSLEEVIEAKEIFNEACSVLQKEKKPYAQNVQFGIMVEVPAAVMLVEPLCGLVDFFSIGTNDLTQYTLAVDRTNERVAHLASPFHPAVIQLIARTINVAHAKGKWVGLCGEMAGNPLALPLLLGLGLDEFSMTPVAIPHMKELIRGVSKSECENIAQQALSFTTTTDVIEFLQDLEI